MPSKKRIVRFGTGQPIAILGVFQAIRYQYGEAPGTSPRDLIQLWNGVPSKGIPPVYNAIRDKPHFRRERRPWILIRENASVFQVKKKKKKVVGRIVGGTNGFQAGRTPTPSVSESFDEIFPESPPMPTTGPSVGGGESGNSVPENPWISPEYSISDSARDLLFGRLRPGRNREGNAEAQGVQGQEQVFNVDLETSGERSERLSQEAEAPEGDFPRGNPRISLDPGRSEDDSWY